MIIGIGDIHAYEDKFDDLLYKLNNRFDFNKDTLVFLGDYVDGGPNAREVVSKLIDLQQKYPHWVFLKGNHEDMMLDALIGRSRIYGDMRMWWQQGGMQTFESYHADHPYNLYSTPLPEALLNFIPTDHLDWMNRLPTLHETEHFVFVHAGLWPGTYPEKTPVKERLWIRRMFIDSDYDWGKRVIFGHTVQGERPLVEFNKIGIDTMHHGHGRISAVVLDERRPGWYDIIQSKE